MHQKKRFPNLLSLSNRPQIALERSASRLQRAFTTQIDKLGNKGWRQEVMVEHVHVHPGRAAGEVPLVHQPGDLAPALMRRALGTKAARDNCEDSRPTRDAQLRAIRSKEQGPECLGQFFEFSPRQQRSDRRLMRVRSCGPLFARSSGMLFSPRSKFNATSFAELHLMGRRGTFPNIVTGFEFRAGFALVRFPTDWL
jgi:hypothetical protein